MQKPLFVLGVLAACVAGPVCAHNPDTSWAVARVVGDTLEVDVEMATEAAMALLGVPMGTQPGPEDRNELIAPLTKVAGEVYQFSLGDAALELRTAVVEMREEDGAAFHLVFALPAGAKGRVNFVATYLEKLTPVHRSAITLVDVHGGVIVGRMLTPDKLAGDLPLPVDG
jgi:hypothetical protein